jgi:trigger factor
MNIVVEKQPKCVATLRVEIPAEKVLGQREQIVRGYASKARIPGFRPGKAPRSVVEKRFGKDIEEELQGQLFNEAIDEAVKQEALKVLDVANPDEVSTQPDGALSFAVQLTLAPEFQLPEYKGLTVTVPPAEVPEQEIQAQLKSLQERFADFKDIEGRSAAMGDFAVIDYTSTVEGKPTDEFIGKPAGYLSGREGFWIRLDEKAFLPGFAAKLEGASVNQSLDITLTLPADFPVADLRDREIFFSVTVKELKQAELPPLDDELAQKLAPGKTLADITEIIRTNMKVERDRHISDMKVNQIVAQLNSGLDFELPEHLVNSETQDQADAMVSRGVQAGMSEEEIASQQQEIFASANQQALTNLRTNFLMQEIARMEQLVVSDMDLINHLAQVANSRKIAAKKLIKDMQKAGRLPSVRSSLLIGKAIDFLIEHANVVESAETALSEEE